MHEHPFQSFLRHFVPLIARKSKQLHAALWILETTGSDDAAFLMADLSAEMKLLHNDPKMYEQLLVWDRDPMLKDPILKRQLNVLIRGFKQNNVSKELLEELSQKESLLSQSYAGFRPIFEGKEVSENDIRELLKNETHVERRKAIWEASKAIGPVLAPQILKLVELRNKVAKSLGYSDYFQMQLDLQEVDPKWLLKTLEDFGKQSDAAYAEVLDEINAALTAKYHTKQLGPWAWSEPFCQEDPLDNVELDKLVEGVDISAASVQFYERLGMGVEGVLKRSDMFERTGKNQHAFCINMDREGDVRTLNNIRSSIKWLETVLHELGHAIYEMYYDSELPWLLREPPHMITTEAMALIAGRQAYREKNLRFLVYGTQSSLVNLEDHQSGSDSINHSSAILKQYGSRHDLSNLSHSEALQNSQNPAACRIGSSTSKEKALKKSDQSLRRRQLIFSRWVLVMTAFESEMYRDPLQDLNKLWWELVEKYQKIYDTRPGLVNSGGPQSGSDSMNHDESHIASIWPRNDPSKMGCSDGPPNSPNPAACRIQSTGREGRCDWACKYHIGLAPVYYFSYLLGEMFASSIQESVEKICGDSMLSTPQAGKFLEKKLFAPGNRMPWSDLVQHVTGQPLSGDAWIREFC